MAEPWDAVDWSTLDHAYGPATDVPPLLQAIAESDVRDVHTLANLLAHQGWCTPKPARATTPALLALAEHFLGTGVSGSPDRRWLDDADVAAMRGLILAHDGAPWLADRSKAVRSAAALCLAVTAQGHDALIARLAKEKDEAVRVDLLIALGWTGAPPEMLRTFLSASSAPERTAAGVALAMGGALDEAVVEALYEGMAMPSPKGCVFAGGALSRVVGEVLRQSAASAGRMDLLEGASTKGAGRPPTGTAVTCAGSGRSPRSSCGWPSASSTPRWSDPAASPSTTPR